MSSATTVNSAAVAVGAAVLFWTFRPRTPEGWRRMWKAALVVPCVLISLALEVPAALVEEAAKGHARAQRVADWWRNL